MHACNVVLAQNHDRCQWPYTCNEGDHMDQADSIQPREISLTTRRARSHCFRATVCIVLLVPCIAATLLTWDWIGVFGRSSTTDLPIAHGTFWRSLVTGVWFMIVPWLVAWWSLASREILRCVAIIAHSEASFAAGDGTRSSLVGVTTCFAVCTFLWGLPLFFEAYDFAPIMYVFAILSLVFIVLQVMLAHLYVRRLGWLLFSGTITRLATYSLLTILLGGPLAFIATGSMYDNTPQGQDRLMLGTWIVIILTISFEAAMLVSLMRSLRRVVDAASKTSPS